MMSIKSNRMLPIVIALLCFLPIILAYSFYYSGYHFDSFGKTNYGQFVEPAQSFNQLKHPNGTAVAVSELEGRWALLFVMPSVCDQNCQDKIFQIQQMQIALGKYQDRLLKFVVVSDRIPLPLSEKYNIHPQAVLIGPETNFWQPHQLYLMDPSGNIILSYKAQFDGKKVLSDLKHLIKLSTSAR